MRAQQTMRIRGYPQTYLSYAMRWGRPQIVYEAYRKKKVMRQDMRVGNPSV